MRRTKQETQGSEWTSCAEKKGIKDWNGFGVLESVKIRRYGPLRGPTSSSCGGLRPSAEAFFALRAKKELIMLFWPIFGIFCVQ